MPWPSDIDASRRWRERVIERAPSAVLMSREVEPGDPLVPAAARVLAGRLVAAGETARLLVSAARDTTKLGLSVWLSVQWRRGGRPPTIMVLWRNGKRDHAMIGARRVTHTDVGAVGAGTKIGET